MNTITTIVSALAGSVLLAATEAPIAPPAAPAKAGPVVCTIDDTHSLALFRIQHMGAGQFWGRFNGVTGNFAFQQGSAEGMRFDVTIQAESVDTGVPALDKHLRSPDFFGAKDFPTMTFKSTSARPAGQGSYEVSGDLTMHGVTRPVTAIVEFTGMADMGKGASAGFEARFSVKRSDFGMKYGVDGGAIGDEVKVVVALEGGVSK